MQIVTLLSFRMWRGVAKYSHADGAEKVGRSLQIYKIPSNVNGRYLDDSPIHSRAKKWATCLYYKISKSGLGGGDIRRANLTLCVYIYR